MLPAGRGRGLRPDRVGIAAFQGPLCGIVCLLFRGEESLPRRRDPDASTVPRIRVDVDAGHPKGTDFEGRGRKIPGALLLGAGRPRSRQVATSFRPIPSE